MAANSGRSWPLPERIRPISGKFGHVFDHVLPKTAHSRPASPWISTTWPSKANKFGPAARQASSCLVKRLSPPYGPMLPNSAESDLVVVIGACPRGVLRRIRGHIRTEARKLLQYQSNDAYRSFFGVLYLRRPAKLGQLGVATLHDIGQSQPRSGQIGFGESAGGNCFQAALGNHVSKHFGVTFELLSRCRWGGEYQTCLEQRLCRREADQVALASKLGFRTRARLYGPESGSAASGGSSRPRKSSPGPHRGQSGFSPEVVGTRVWPNGTCHISLRQAVGLGLRNGSVVARTSLPILMFWDLPRVGELLPDSADLGRIATNFDELCTRPGQFQPRLVEVSPYGARVG